MADIAELNIKVTTGEVKTGVTELSKLEKQGARTEKSIDGLSQTAKRLATYFAAWKVGSFLKDAALLAARYETLGVTMRVAGENAGYSAKQMAVFENQLKSQGIASVEAREVLTRMSAAYMDLSRSSELAGAAQNLAVAGGINSSQAFERLVYAIQSGQTEMLRTIGLNVQFDDAYKQMAASIGKNVKELTTQEKMQARVNIVLEKAAGYNGLYEEAMKTAGKQITSFARYWQDLQLELGRSQLPAVTKTVELLKEKLKEATAYLSKSEIQDELAGIGETAISTTEDLLKFGAAFGGAFVKILQGWNALPEVIQEYGLMALIGGKVFGPHGIAIVSILSAYTAFESKMKSAAQIDPSDGLDWTEEFSLWVADLENGTNVLEKIKKQMAEISEGGHIFRGTVSPPSEAMNLTLSDSAKSRVDSELLAFFGNIESASEPTKEYGPALSKKVNKFSLAGYEKTAEEMKFDAEFTADFSGADAKFAEIERKQEQQLASDKQVRLEFSREYIRIIKGESAAKMAEIDRMAADYLAAGADELAVAQWVAQEKLEASRKWADGAVRELQDYADAATNAADNVGDAFTSAMGGMEDSLVDFVQNGKLSFSSLADSIISDLTRIAVRQSITGPLASGLSGVIGKIFGNSNSGELVYDSASSVGPFLPSAKGNAFSGGGISSLSNGIYSSPTYFGFDQHVTKFAKGGVLGEAGVEGVLPLARTSGGDLGVKTVGNGESQQIQPMVVQFNISAVDGASVQAMLVNQKPLIVGMIQQSFNMQGKSGPRDNKRY